MKTLTLKQFASLAAQLTKTDRWVFLVCDGDMGEGKSCFTTQHARASAALTKTPFNYQDNMTYQRKELKAWIDGDKKNKIKRKPENSSILADELISMFFKRNWFDNQQIDGIELLNKCRDRHLLIEGNIPNFWDLDSAIYSLITFWVHIHERGRAWVFEKDRNPFAADKWHKRENEKLFKKHKNPYRCHGFLCEIHFPDWDLKDKQEYYKIRNIKRVKTEGQRQKEDRYKDIKEQRNTALMIAHESNPKLTLKDFHNLIPSLSKEAIRLILKGLR